MILKKLRGFEIKTIKEKIIIIDDYYNQQYSIEAGMIEENLNIAVDFIKLHYNIEEEEIVGLVNNSTKKILIVKTFKKINKK